MSESDGMTLRADRLPDGAVKLTLGEAEHVCSEQEWVELVAGASTVGVTEGSVATAAMFHKGRVSVEVQVDQHSIGRVMLKQAGGIALPEIVKPNGRPVLSLPRR